MSAAPTPPRTSRVTAVRVPGAAAAPTPPAAPAAAAAPPAADPLGEQPAAALDGNDGNEGEDNGEALTAGAPDLDDGAATAEKPQTITMTQDQLDAAIARAVSKGISNTLAMQRAASAPVRDAELPDQSEIDRDRITRPVLSKQGYVVPAKYGQTATPAAHRSLI